MQKFPTYLPYFFWTNIEFKQKFPTYLPYFFQTVTRNKQVILRPYEKFLTYLSGISDSEVAVVGVLHKFEELLLPGVGHGLERGILVIVHHKRDDQCRSFSVVLTWKQISQW